MNEFMNSGGDDVRIERVRADVKASVARAKGLVAQSRGLFRDPLAGRSDLGVTEALIVEEVDSPARRTG